MRIESPTTTDAKKMTMTPRRLLPILGDQLSLNLSSLQEGDKSTDIIVMMEVADETTYVRHHKKKIAFILSAMRHFAVTLRKAGWTVDYIKLDDAKNTGSFTGELKRAIKKHDPSEIIVTEPSEWRVRQDIEAWQKIFNTPVTITSDDRFLAAHEDFRHWASGRKQLRMEYFYRDMRRKTNLLMDGDKPVGGKWNFDSDNRKPAEADLFLPKHKTTRPDNITKDVLELVAKKFPTHFGDLKPFWFAVTQDQAQKVFEHFVEHALPFFGDYQDAMLTQEKFLYHSLISMYLNVGLLDPLDVCKRVERAYLDGDAPLNCVEGYIRQIIGWREYVRGIYWLKMPGYVEENFLDADRRLPDFYWTGDTDMACLRAAIMQTKEEAYAHHIQRLMVTGNFALLIGAEPKEVHEWYLAVYADAFEWVELPNTLGMSQFADGGLLGSKPYASSGNYINKMSDYCGQCTYKIKEKTGENACPFNALYWHFLVRNKDALKTNPRMAQMYRTWDRMADDKKSAYLASADKFLNTLI